jgi:DNA-binding MarR family transcriptional regulator
MDELPGGAESRASDSAMPTEASLAWLETVLPRIMRRLMDAENLDMPLLQLPLAQMRLAYALYPEQSGSDCAAVGETMGRLSDRLGVRQNALTQAADRLVRHGLAERLSDPSDRRVVRLRLTDTGTAWVRERRERRHEHLGALWAELNEFERQEFLHAVNVLQAVAERLNARTRRDLEGNSLPDKSSHHEESSRSALPTVEETLARFTVGAANGAASRLADQPRPVPQL